MTDAHQQRVRFAGWKIGLAVFIGIGVVVGLYFAFRYTLIADFRETQSSVDISDDLAYGELLFVTRGCSGCHTHDDAGSIGDDGPDLTEIGVRADREYIRESIVDPNAVIAGNCPEEACEADVMPQYGNILATDQIDALVLYLTTPIE